MAIAAGVSFSCALMMDGTACCWEKHAQGQPGYELVTTENPVPGTVIGISGAVAMMADGFHACALLTDGTVRYWEWNNASQLGAGAPAPATFPRAPCDVQRPPSSMETLRRHAETLRRHAETLRRDAETLRRHAETVRRSVSP